MFERMREDIQSVFHRDPAARTTAEVLLCYPGLHAVWGHRITHWLWQQDRKTLAYFLQNRISEVMSADIHPAARIGEGVMLDHGTGVVVGRLFGNLAWPWASRSSPNAAA